ncbi:protein SPMIP1-like [Saccoglossus kowalevskii]|uniref:Uncharacterized protein LOC100366722 n=1 Tax=Saccoglossus kowalevskii TaxID=10224 RepID=A0ABM0GYE7_SACKO|nr:PREDICTED: uncharacterized protein LOC100366722 [Saccoglossus kowalevskii]
MSRVSLDTQKQNFLVESIEKEMMHRLRWQTKYSKEFAKQFYRDSELKRVETPKERPTRAKLLHLQQPKRNHLQYVSKIKRFDEEKVEQQKEKSSPPLTTEMRPVSMKTKSLLYQGFSKIGEGRQSYLHARKQKKPYDRYEFPVTNSWEYGWKIDDYMKYYTPSKHGVSHVVQDTFYRPNGVPLDESEFQR